MHRDSGFTLAETLAALAVFSIAAMAMLHLAGQNARAASVAREHAFAGVVAENAMVEAMADPAGLAAGTLTGEAEMDGRRWAWTRDVTRTSEPGMLRIDVAVRAEGEDFVSASLTGFRAGGR